MRDWLNGARANAKRKGRDFTITREDIEPLPTHCQVLGLPLEFHVGGRRDNSYSLDRVDSSKGYTPDNVVVMSYRANKIKTNATRDELLAVADWIRDGL